MGKLSFAAGYALYYFIARHLPGSDVPYSLGSKKIRAFCCRRIFKKFGKILPAGGEKTGRKGKEKSSEKTG